MDVPVYVHVGEAGRPDSSLPGGEVSDFFMVGQIAFDCEEDEMEGFVEEHIF